MILSLSKLLGVKGLGSENLNDDEFKDFSEKWKRAVSGFVMDPKYPDFIKKCGEFTKVYSKEILVDETTEYKEVTEQ